MRDSLGGYMVGELDGTLSDRARELAAALEPVGRTRVTDNVRGMIWSKLLINSTFTGLSAVSGLRYGGAAEQGREAVFCLWREGVAVGEAQGLELVEIHDVHPHDFDEAGLAKMMEHMANVRPSMLQDLDAGRDTEVDVVNGGVVAKGREVGVATPCNERVVEVVHSIERGERSSEPRWLRLRQRSADDQRHRQLKSRRHPGRGVQLLVEARGWRACPGSAGRGSGSRRPARPRRRRRRPPPRRGRSSPRR